MRFLILTSSFFLQLLLISCEQRESIKNTNNQEEIHLADKENRTRYTFSQGMEADFGVSTGTYYILYQYSTPVDTFYQTAFPIGQDSILYQRLGMLTIQDDELGEYEYADKKELFVYDGANFHPVSLPLFNRHMSSFILHDYTLYYWGINEYMYACTYNLKTKQHTKIRLGPIVETDFDGTFVQPNIHMDGTFSFQLFDNENTQWTISKDGTKIISFKQRTRQFKNYDEYLKVRNLELEQE
jgi:hypothetical protein